MELLDKARHLKIFLVEVLLEDSDEEWHRWDHGWVTEKLPREWNDHPAVHETGACGNVWQQTGIERATYAKSTATTLMKYLQKHTKYAFRIRRVDIKITDSVIEQGSSREPVSPEIVACYSCENEGSAARLYSFTRDEFHKLDPHIQIAFFTHCTAPLFCPARKRPKWQNPGPDCHLPNPL